MSNPIEFNLYICQVTVMPFTDPVPIGHGAKERIVLIVGASPEDAEEKARLKVEREFPRPNWTVADPFVNVVDRETVEYAARAVLRWGPKNVV